MKIGIIDGDSSARTRLKSQILSLRSSAQIFEADSGNTALALFASEELDIIFIDVELGGVDGTSLAAAAKKLKPRTGIVIVASNSEHALKAFEIGADDYILKPLDPYRIEKVLNRFRASEEKSIISGRLAVSIDHRVVFIDYPSVIYIETSGRGCVIHTKNGDFSENRTIGKYEEKLPKDRFFRIHKSFIVNTDMISEIFPWQAGNLGIKMKGFDAVLPVGRNQSKILRSEFRIQ